MTPHPDFPRFFAVLKNNRKLFTSRKEDVFRQGLPRWMSLPYRFTGVGSVIIGARWSVRGLTPTLYASTDPITLSREAYYKSLRYGWTSEDFRPQLVINMRWELQRIVDLTDATTLRALHVTKKAILSCDWYAEQLENAEPVTQAIGRAAFENLAEGLVVPSARRPGGVNLVFYPSHRQPGTVIKTLHETEIPFMHGL